MHNQSEGYFASVIKGLGIPNPEPEYRFHPTRKWRFDFGWPKLHIAVELEGGVFSGGRHTQGKGFTEDCRKYNEAALLDWRVFRFTTEQINNGEAFEFLERVFYESSKNTTLVSRMRPPGR